mmetsp:Transcript_18770/g.53793  ORF Transcript_18770/g.53793 Transcript_18770/m.53793 type:complete len:202 (+) Transcript_18770:77-682(+)
MAGTSSRSSPNGAGSSHTLSPDWLLKTTTLQSGSPMSGTEALSKAATLVPSGEKVAVAQRSSGNSQSAAPAARESRSPDRASHIAGCPKTSRGPGAAFPTATPPPRETARMSAASTLSNSRPERTSQKTVCHRSLSRALVTNVSLPGMKWGSGGGMSSQSGMFNRSVLIKIAHTPGLPGETASSQTNTAQPNEARARAATR